MISARCPPASAGAASSRCRLQHQQRRWRVLDMAATLAGGACCNAVRWARGWGSRRPTYSIGEATLTHYWTATPKEIAAVGPAPLVSLPCALLDTPKAQMLRLKLLLTDLLKEKYCWMAEKIVTVGSSPLVSPVGARTLPTMLPSVFLKHKRGNSASQAAYRFCFAASQA